jgi:integrase
MELPIEKLRRNLAKFDEHLLMKGRAIATVIKHRRAIKKFSAFLQENQCEKIHKKDVFNYRDYLFTHYKMTTVNSYLVSLNLYFSFLNIPELRVKTLPVQRKTNLDSVLNEAEYKALINTAKRWGKERLYLIMQTLASTGMKIGELQYITPEVLKQGSAFIRASRKVREVMLPNYLCQELLAYCEKEKIKNLVFHGRNPDKLLDKAFIWRELKALARLSGVSEFRVFPNNFRHYFAQRFLAAYNDTVDLADILGHSPIGTTRTYTRTSDQEKKNRINNLKI